MRLSLMFLVSFACFMTDCMPSAWSHPKVNGFTEPPRELHVCINLPERHMEDAFSAVKDWDRSLRQWRRLIPVRTTAATGCHYNVVEIESQRDDNPYVLAWTSSIGGSQIYMKRGFYEFDTRGILMHELGHALGAQHVPGTLMNATHDRRLFSCPDATTVAQVAAWNKINLDALCWCLR